MSHEKDNRPREGEEKQEFKLFRRNRRTHQPKVLPATLIEGEIPDEFRRKKRREKSTEELTDQRQPKYKKGWRNKSEDDQL